MRKTPISSAKRDLSKRGIYEKKNCKETYVKDKRPTKER